MQGCRTVLSGNGLEIFEAYKQHLEETSKTYASEIAMTQTALVRFTVPGFGGSVPC